MSIIRKISGIAKRKSEHGTKCRFGSVQVLDKGILEAFSADPNNTYLVSFPRTGSHWLRMLMELYFERPSLVRVFYYPDRKDYLTLHTHDLNLDVERSHVIYIFRDPVDTIYSQLNYYGQPLDDRERVVYWADLYGRHLAKWLHEEQFTTKKTILTYEGMTRNLSAEFLKITCHFNCEFDETRFQTASNKITKEEVKRKTVHDPQVIQLTMGYGENRMRFKKEAEALVWDALCDEGRQYLIDDFL